MNAFVSTQYENKEYKEEAQEENETHGVRYTMWIIRCNK
jgi:hypothetical protein